MGNPNFAAGLPPVEPKLQHVVNIITRSLKIDMNCVQIGTIQSIDFTTMTATIQIAFQQQLRSGAYENIPILTDVPVFTLQGGGYSIQFPIAVGDTAIVLFSDRNIDNWFQSGGVQPPADGRLHSLSDAIAIVGINSLSSKLALLPTGEAGITDGHGTKMAMTSGKITIQNTGQSLLRVLNDLLSALESLTVTVSGSSGTVSPATVAQLEAVGTELATLLY